MLQWARDAYGFVVKAAATVFTTMVHPRSSWGSWSILNRTARDYSSEVRADSNSIVVAAIRWAQRNFSEAPPMLEQWNEGRQEFDQHYRAPLLALLKRPNDHYSGTTLWDATIADRMLTGDAYWIKVRSQTGRPLQFWWAPESTMEPMGDDNDPAVFISHYRYSPGGNIKPIDLRVQDVVHFQSGQDPENPRKGLSPMKALFREIYTDDEAANHTASLLSNAGIPGVIISPKAGKFTKEQADEIKQSYIDKFSGDKRGEAMVMGGQTEIQQFGFSPEQLNLRSLRGIPEERITALLGINSAVLGLGAGLSTTKVGATLREYREEATESFMVPLWRSLGEELTHDLLPDFYDEEWQIGFNLAKVRVLQDDENRRADNLAKRLDSGAIKVSEYRRALGMVVAPEHEVYLRKAGVTAVPAGMSPDEQLAISSAPKQLALPAPSGDAADAVAAAEAAVRR